MDIDANIQQALAFKSEGNALVSEGNYRDAAKKYVRIFLYIRGIKSPDSMMMMGPSSLDSKGASNQQIGNVDSLELSANLNLALCYLKLEEPDKVIQFSTGALKVDENNVKALFRRGSAYMMKNSLDEARGDLEKAASISPGDRSISGAFAKLKKLEHEYTKEMSKNFSFGNKGIFM